MKLGTCPICKAPAEIFPNPETRADRVVCYRCGTFLLDVGAVMALMSAEWSQQQTANASGYIRQNAGLLLTGELVERLSDLPMPSVGEKTERLLVSLSRVHPQPGASFAAPVWGVEAALRVAPAVQSFGDSADSDPDYHSLKELKWLAIATASNPAELGWLIFDCLLKQGLLTEGHRDGDVVITPLGWREIERLKQVNEASRFGFVAMSFRDEFIPLYERGIAPGIAAAGYKPLRVDRTEHNNRIDDEIIVRIKQSRFLVADFSVNRGGIYFEAGYAMGLGLEVIWVVREDHLNCVHFDNRQYNFIVWQEGEWNSLANRLRLRIEATTIGRGPVSETGDRPGLEL